MAHSASGFFGHTPSSQSTVDQTIATSRRELKQVYDNLNRFFKQDDPSSSNHKHNIGVIETLAAEWDNAEQIRDIALKQSTQTSVAEPPITPTTPTQSA